MNRLELEKKIITEGKKRKIEVTECRIYDRGEDGLDFYPTIRNDYNIGWVYKHQAAGLIDDIAPIERKHKVGRIGLAYRTFKKGDIIQMDDIWIRMDAIERDKDIKNILDYGSCCGQWRQGWMKGKVIEFNEMLTVVFDRDVWYENGESVHINSVTDLEKAQQNGNLIKIEKGQPMYCGFQYWGIRKYKSEASGGKKK
jgi:hypothetical protein